MSAATAPIATPLPVEAPEAPGVRKGLLIFGLVLLGSAGALWLWAKRHPCHCGEAQVDEVARASAEMAEKDEDA